MTEAAPLPSDAAASTSASASTANIDQTVTVPDKPTHYHQYCFHLSPTFNKYCPMRARDLVRLDEYDAFEGQNIFFHLNHPIQWVRICGFVLAVEKKGSRDIFTLDDGSGFTVECVLPYEQPRKQNNRAPGDHTSRADSIAKEDEQAIRGSELVDKVVEARGHLQLFEYSTTNRRFLQIQTNKHKVLHSTQQEVAFWTKANKFACDTLNKPWVLDKEIVRACRREARNGISKHCTAADQFRSLSTEAGSIQPKKWQIKRAAGEDEPMGNTKQPSARAKRVMPKKWQIKREQYDDEPVEEPPEQEAMELDNDTTPGSEEPEAPTAYIRRHTPRPEPMEVDAPVRKKQPKKWCIKQHSH